MPHTHSHTYYHRRIKESYILSPWQRLHTTILVPAIIILAVFVFSRFFFVSSPLSPQTISVVYLGKAFFATFARLSIAYILAFAVAIPLALLVHKNLYAERIFLPLFDIIQSVPVLAFFPLIILFFLRYNFANAAAIVVIFLAMLWNIVFNVVGGLKVVPNDLKAAAFIFHVHGFAYIRQILLPAVVPYMVIGSLLAWAQGWNIIIVAEVLHPYIPGGTSAQDLFGIGSILVSASSSGQHLLFFAALVAIVLGIAAMNLLVWQRLLHYAENYRFE